MANYSALLAELHSLGDTGQDNIFRQASDAIEELLSQHFQVPTESSSPDEPSDHEAEGAMLYVMSRGKSIA